MQILPLREKARSSGPVLLAALLLSLAVFAIVGYLHFDDRVRAYQLMDDVAYSAGVKWYTGLLSYVVILLWCASAAVCGFAGWVLRESGDSRLRRLGAFLLSLAVVNVWLTFDDLFLIHEQAARLLVGRSFQHEAEGLLFGLYAVILTTVFWWYRRVIARTEYLLLGIAIVSLLASAVIDVSFQLEMDGRNVFREAVLSVSWGPPVIDMSEEILKLNGAMLWFGYFCMTGVAGVRDFSGEHTMAAR